MSTFVFFSLEHIVTLLKFTRAYLNTNVYKGKETPRTTQRKKEGREDIREEQRMSTWREESWEEG